MVLSSPRVSAHPPSPAFRAAAECLALVEPVAAALPPEWRYLAVHLRKAGTAVLIALALCAGLSRKRQRRLVGVARLRAYDLVGSLQAATVGSPASSQAAELAAHAYLELVRRLAPST